MVIWIFWVILVSPASLASEVIPNPTIRDCLENKTPWSLGLSLSDCLLYAIPEGLDECFLIPKDVERFHEIILKCHTISLAFDESSCEQLPLSDYDKWRCYCACSKNRFYLSNEPLFCDKPFEEIKAQCMVNAKKQRMELHFKEQRASFEEFKKYLFYHGVPIVIFFLILLAKRKYRRGEDYFRFVEVGISLTISFFSLVITRAYPSEIGIVPFDATFFLKFILLFVTTWLVVRNIGLPALKPTLQKTIIASIPAIFYMIKMVFSTTSSFTTFEFLFRGDIPRVILRGTLSFWYFSFILSYLVMSLFEKFPIYHRSKSLKYLFWIITALFGAFATYTLRRLLEWGSFIV